MATKLCSICKLEKSIDCFAIKNKEKNKYSSECKDCHKILRKEYYKNNAKKEQSRIKERKKEIRLWILDYKKNLKCEKCNENHISVLQFHHSSPSEKELQLSEVANYGWSIDRIKKEIEKCIILCANCHLKLHWTN